MIKDYHLHFPPVLISEDEQSLHIAVHDFVEKEIMPVREKLEDDLEPQKKIRSLFVDMGLQRLSMSKAYGGSNAFHDNHRDLKK